ncbi:bifunctional 3-(3-hydroxy-phenyl)propionate/3-hydroxycinnamic acid hydroxylase [Pusillimonas sp.]|uniref:bifunctional 3-(3-hydroxy-phenyl)propionate/3-hydroxycinnamic acid hydroxylase MhpA n=1 Tax=Pusillimonas sp. TaxID=3040095 RepID=UPI0029BA21D3|nr:bifunctional 3-(3-hydroxy-phenyl)propionate/3-hydroxycinnamic acid hydroxylase [Pusillimonas sp.]MDX3894707.1 bifunctional 3-(3-hydroxy-phenyl)propionate/3-hydroxycinnamic acid hydroxylase [Pusillimonas sp.]
MEKIYDVAVVGMGPVGAVLTALLGKYGLDVINIEKDPEVFPLPRAAHIDHTGLRTIQETGCLDEILAEVIRNTRLDLLNADLELLSRIPAGQRSVSGLPTSVYFYQPEFDRTLRKAAMRFPSVTVRTGVCMTSIDQHADQGVVELEAVNETGAHETITARWVVGCDGARSPTRELSGITLSSLDFDEQWLVIDLKVDVRKHRLPADHVIEVCDPKRPYLTTPIAKDRQRFEFMLLEGEDHATMLKHETITRLLARWIPEGAYTIDRAAVYTFHGIVADEWRKGRVLIAGDAAHQTPPFLGQGMCAGIRDAANLAWKLRRVVRGLCGDAILDTYQTERAPHAAKVIKAAIRIGKVICELDPERAAERDRLLLTNDKGSQDNLLFSLPPLEEGPLVRKGGGNLFVQPQLDGRYLDDIVGSRFLIVAKSEAALGCSVQWWKTEMDAHVAIASELDSPELERWFKQNPCQVVVVRPDRYVLGTSDLLDTITEEVRSVLADKAVTA